MAQEIEAKFLKINREDIEKKLLELGAEKQPEKLFRSMSFDFPGFPMDKESCWIRLRNEGDKVTLAYKKRLGVTSVKGNDAGMEEIEVVVSDYDQTAEILGKIGMIVKFAQEKKRTTWVKDSVHFDIDTWPKLEPYLEIEASSWDDIDNYAIKLCLDLKDKKMCSASQVYEMNGIDPNKYIKMNFDEFIER